MGQALYRKYRSKTLGEIVGQEHITTTLQNALKAGRISHAYLFTGPRGVGKTSIARILAYEINGLAYSDEAPLDIIEIDAASNRRIDEIRELRERVNTAPASATYKVYIIDEVHMLTKEAFNALLKTLEEPPAHVVFILATTEAYKLPDTIISRTQRFNFRPAAVPAVVAHLKMIAKKEKITIEEAALELIAEHGDGSFRDSVSLLDQVSNTADAIALADVEAMLGLAPIEAVEHLTQTISSHDSSLLAESLTGLYAQGYEPAMLAAQIAATLRVQLLSPNTPTMLTAATKLQLLRQLLDVPAARSPRQLLELILLQHTIQTPVAPIEQPTTFAVQQPTVTAATLTKPINKEPISIVKPAPKPMAKPTKETATVEPTTVSQQSALQVAQNVLPTELWQQILDQIKQKYNTLYGILRMATPELTDNQLTLRFAFAFHQRRVNEPKNRKLISDIIEQSTGNTIKVVCIVDPVKPGSAVPAPSHAPVPANQTVSAISNIFGGAELLES